MPVGTMCVEEYGCTNRLMANLQTAFLKMEEQTGLLSSVMLADDDLEDKEIFCVALHEVCPGMAVKTARNGKELLQTLDASGVDLVFLDINMFPVNGLEALKLLKQQQHYAHLPVVMYSCSGNPNEIKAAYENGAHLFFRKTDTFQQLKAALQDIINMDWRQPETIRTQYFNKRFPAV